MAHFEEHMPDTHEHETLIDTAAAAARIGMAEITLRIWRWKRNPNAPPYTRVGSRGIRYSPAALDAWLEKRTHAPGMKPARKRRSK
jgi:predicted DNA-binding transcriptional regulator AlpA